MTWIEGIDAAWSRPTPAQMLAADKHFIVGYVSHDSSKNLTKSECQAYLDAGISVGLVWETTEDRALSGQVGGTADGREARKQANALGFPADKPIFTAVDFQATTSQLAGPIASYLIAFAKEVGGKDLAGVYGGLKTVRYCLNNNLVGWGWQTYAWSMVNGSVVWDSRAYAQQYRNGVHIAGHDTDLDRAKDLTGLWTKENPDMADPIDTDNIHAEVWNHGDIPPPKNATKPDKVSAGTALQDARDTAYRIENLLKSSPPADGNLVVVDLDTLRQIVSEEVAKVVNKTSTTFTLNYDSSTTTS